MRVLEHTYSNGEFEWYVEDLWEESEKYPIEVIELSELNLPELLNSHCWSAGKMTINEILDHADRVRDADLTFPIILTPDGWIGDGVHRVVKAYREGKKTILAIRLMTMPKHIGEL